MGQNSERRVVVVTGTASGIGKAIFEEARARGFRVAGADWDADGLRSLQQGGHASDTLLSRVDVRDEDEVENFAQEVVRRFGQIDVVFNNAAIFASGKISEIQAETWSKVFAVNVVGPTNIIRSFVSRMKSQSTPSTMVVTSSISSFVPTSSVGPYSASKFAILAIARTLAIELRKDAPNVTVKLLVPGAVQTDLVVNSPAENSPRVVAALNDAMSQRGVQPREVAEFAFSALDRKGFLMAMHPDVVYDQASQSIEHLFAE